MKLLWSNVSYFSLKIIPCPFWLYSWPYCMCVFGYAGIQMYDNIDLSKELMTFWGGVFGSSISLEDYWLFLALTFVKWCGFFLSWGTPVLWICSYGCCQITDFILHLWITDFISRVSLCASVPLDLDQTISLQRNPFVCC